MPPTTIGFFILFTLSVDIHFFTYPQVNVLDENANKSKSLNFSMITEARLSPTIPSI